MYHWFVWVMLLVLAVSGCSTPAPESRDGKAEVSVRPDQQELALFSTVVQRVEPVAEQMCRSLNRASRCRFQIVIDDRPDQPRNAFQTLDTNNRPIIVFTTALIKDARNADELAFVMGHEMAHHIANHIPQVSQSAMSGAFYAGRLAAQQGLDAAAIEAAQRLGAGIAVLTYAKEFELQADAIGAEIAFRAGFDPVRGSAYFDRLPDPGNQFLSTHPGTAQRKAVVRQVVQSLNPV